AVDALGRVVDGQAVLARLDGAFSLGRAGTGGGFFFGGLFLQVCALHHQLLLRARHHVVVLRELDGVLYAEIGAVAAERAAAEEEAAGDERALLRFLAFRADGAAGADALAHAAADTQVGVEHDAAAVAQRGLYGLEGIGLRAGPG